MTTEGSVTSGEVIQALFELGGEASSKQIEDRVIENRGQGLPQWYLHWDSYRKTINQRIQNHTLGYRKYKGPSYIEKLVSYRPITFHLLVGKDLEIPAKGK